MPPIEKLLEVVQLSSQGLSVPRMAEVLGVSGRTVRRRLRAARESGLEVSAPGDPNCGGGVEVERGAMDVAPLVLPDIKRWDQAPRPEDNDSLAVRKSDDEEEEPVEDILRRRRERYEKLSKRKASTKVRVVDVKMRGPIGICHFGDPHIDDDGCNIAELMHTVQVVSSTPAMYGGMIGDVWNNWLDHGRLSKLWQYQSTTSHEALRLAEWLMCSVPWSYAILGNHDKWNHGDQILRLILRGANVSVFAENTARVEFRFPKGDPIRIHCRHDYRGSSVWNRAHGGLKESKLNPWSHVYVSGHRHIWAQHAEEGMDGVPRHALVVRGYKFHDKYADTQGFYEHQHGYCCTTILNPTASSPMERIRVVWDVEEAAEMLTWMRRRAGVAKA